MGGGGGRGNQNLVPRYESSRAEPVRLCFRATARKMARGSEISVLMFWSPLPVSVSCRRRQHPMVRGGGRREEGFKGFFFTGNVWRWRRREIVRQNRADGAKRGGRQLPKASRLTETLSPIHPSISRAPHGCRAQAACRTELQSVRKN